MDPTVVAAWIAAGVSFLTLIGTLVAQYLGFRATSRDAEKTAEEQRKQLDRTLAEQRDQLDKTLKAQSEQLNRTLVEQRTRTLNERFATVSDQLGSDKPPEVRLAGVYAMAGLADDWEENRQVCVNVLCAYLRMPYEPDPGEDSPASERLAFRSSREVRHTVIRVITAHLKDGAPVSWQGLNFDFTGVVFDGGDFSGACFSGGTVSFRSAQFSSGLVDFTFARFSGGKVDFQGAEFSGGIALFDYARFSGGMVRFSGVRFSGGTVAFSQARFSGGWVEFMAARFSGGTISFGAAQFSGGTINFGLAQFSGGTVDFSYAGNWSSPPKFPWTDTPPPGVKLPRK
jgi:uncharacterized protein YjbI with pentapeptide repeats